MVFVVSTTGFSHMSLDLDSIANRLQSGDVTAGMQELIAGLSRYRSESDPARWKQFIKQARRHPVCHLVHQDPFTYRAFVRPRGYAGDAVTLDMMYQLHPGQPVDGLAKQVFALTINSPAPKAVRARRQLLAERLAKLRPRSEVLSIAAGHLREYDHFIQEPNRFHRFVAIDQDAESLAEVEKAYGLLGVTSVCCSATQIPRLARTLGRFDFVYSAGLFDYFDEQVARRIVRVLARLVKPGGTLLLANFVPNIPDVGYMECFMDWWLVYRTPADMSSLLAPQIVEPEQVFISHDPTGQIVFAEALVQEGGA